MYFDGIRQPDTLYIASVSRGKDSTAMLRAIQLMGWPLDAICSVDIWFDSETPAELPPMVAFKDKWDAKCLEYFKIPVTRLCAKNSSTNRLTYVDIFYRKVSPQRERERIAERQKLQRKLPNIRIPANQRRLVSIMSQTIGTYGFPNNQCRWCTGELKKPALRNNAIRCTVFREDTKGYGATAGSREMCWTEGFRRCARTRRKK